MNANRRIDQRICNDSQNDLNRLTYKGVGLFDKAFRMAHTPHQADETFTTSTVRHNNLSENQFTR